jgi:diguanylate cyclase (GGDEF)-like protein
MIGRAIREKKIVVSNNSPSDPKALLGEQHARSGVRSLAVLPLIVSDQAVGVLALYASESEFFHEEELKLLTELTDDISFALDHIEKEEKLNYLAYYDVLTGLANRTLFLERVAQCMRSAASRGHKLAVFILDLERFRNINDSLGRPAGDALLKQVAAVLSRDAGDPGLLARVGGDHFAIVVPELKARGNIASLLEGKMRAFLGHTFRLGDTELRIPIKVGGALFPDNGTEAATLLQNAEAALKKTKASGDRYLFYTQGMTATVAVKLTLENQLRHAVDNEEFVLHYQPKVNLASGKLTGAEALIRWNDPRTGLVPPGRFIPILEETGLIYEVGRWALGKAIEDYLRWRRAGLAAVRIAVNVSPLQLRHRGFIADMEQVIGIDGHAAAGLELEITESLIMEDVRNSIVRLQAIRDMGICIAIDDFGTGFSSLSYLAKLPVDALKIDRSFVLEMAAAQEGLALVSTIITLAHSLKLKVVAEGVETEEQSRLLRLLTCDEMQGYLFSKPVPGEIFEAQFLALPATA